MQLQASYACVFSDPQDAARLHTWFDGATVHQQRVSQKLLAALSGCGRYGAPGPTRSPSRPSTASENRSRPLITAEGRSCTKALRRPKTAGASPGEGQCAKGYALDPAHSKQQTNAWITMNDQFYGFRKLYPTIYNAAAEASRAVPAPNMLFSSEYAQSLKLGAGPYWNRFLQTTNQAVSGSVYASTMEQKVCLRWTSAQHVNPCSGTKLSSSSHMQASHDQCFFNWVQRQRLYYGDLLTDAAAAKMDQMLEEADDAVKCELLDALRMLYAAVQPTRYTTS